MMLFPVKKSGRGTRAAFGDRQERGETRYLKAKLYKLRQVFLHEKTASAYSLLFIIASVLRYKL